MAYRIPYYHFQDSQDFRKTINHQICQLLVSFLFCPLHLEACIPLLQFLTFPETALGLVYRHSLSSAWSWVDVSTIIPRTASDASELSWAPSSCLSPKRCCGQGRPSFLGHFLPPPHLCWTLTQGLRDMSGVGLTDLTSLSCGFTFDPFS